MKLTKAFPPHVKPVRVGLYQVLVRHMDDWEWEWCWWGGERWGWAYANKRWAASKAWRQADGATQQKTWRGQFAL